MEFFASVRAYLVEDFSQIVEEYVEFINFLIHFFAEADRLLIYACRKII